MYLDGVFINLSEDPHKNLLSHDKKWYSIDSIKGDGRALRGGNGIVFKLTNEETGNQFALKISQFAESQKIQPRIRKRILRFEREIEALYVAKNNYIENVIQIEFDGYKEIDGEEFRYYVMQKCDCTLSEFLSDPERDLTTIQKVLLCKKILAGIVGLHEYNIYHRDIKHDNIFFINGEPLIADLGLVDFRDSDITINERGDLIGPTGWFSPEAINKYLVEKTPNKNKFDIKIDSQSEVFQLGKLFWFIMQGNLPIGQIAYEDFILRDEKLCDMIYSMLEYSKDRRSRTDQVLSDIEDYIGNN